MTNPINKKTTYIVGSAALVLIISLVVAVILNIIKTTKPETTSVHPKICSKGYVVVPGNKKYNTNDFCVMKYEARDSNGKAASFAESEPWTNISQTVAKDLSRYSCDKCHLITENEWMTIADNLLSTAQNWSGGKVGEGYIYSGHNDNSPANTIAALANDYEGFFGTNNSANENQKRTLKLSNGEVIWDFAGNAAEWTDGQMTGGQPGAKEGESVYSWKEWNQLGFNGYLPVKPFPSYNDKTVSSANWNYKQGLGRLYSNSGDETLKALYRGGSYKDGDSAGIYNLNMSGEQTIADPLIGFRVVSPLR